MKKKQQAITTIEGLATLMQGEFLVIHDKFAELRTELKGEINGLRTELKGEISELRGEVNELREELKEEIHELRTELKEEIHDVRVIVKRIDTRTQNQIDAVYEDTAVLKTDMKGVKKDIVSIKTHIGMKA